jgi:hypothetical protein
MLAPALSLLYNVITVLIRDSIAITEDYSQNRIADRKSSVPIHASSSGGYAGPGEPHRMLTDSKNLTGSVFKISTCSVAGGAYSDVWRGLFGDKAVAIKVPRIVNVSPEKLSQVSNITGCYECRTIRLATTFHYIFIFMAFYIPSQQSFNI